MVVVSDLSDMTPVWSISDVAEYWGELCLCNTLVGSDVRRIFRMRTYPPAETYPGYVGRVQVLRGGNWMVNANGTTPANAFLWADASRSPYYASPTAYVKGGAGVLSPRSVAHAVVHELFHLFMPLGMDGHTTDVGWIFSPDMTPQPGLSMITPLAGARLAPAVESLGRGLRRYLDRDVIVPHRLGAGMPPAGPWPGCSPPTAGAVLDARSGLPVALPTSLFT